MLNTGSVPWTIQQTVFKPNRILAHLPHHRRCFSKQYQHGCAIAQTRLGNFTFPFLKSPIVAGAFFCLWGWDVKTHTQKLCPWVGGGGRGHGRDTW